VLDSSRLLVSFAVSFNTFTDSHSLGDRHG
jgi:hypothetical protein